jgi:hypothetical protein
MVAVAYFQVLVHQVVDVVVVILQVLEMLEPLAAQVVVVVAIIVMDTLEEQAQVVKEVMEALEHRLVLALVVVVKARWVVRQVDGLQVALVQQTQLLVHQ